MATTRPYTKVSQAAMRGAKTTAAEAKPVAADVSEESSYARVQAALDGYLASLNLQSWVRNLVSIVLGVIAGSAVFWFSMPVLDMLIMAALTYSGFGFVAFVVAILGVWFVTVSSVTTGMFVSRIVAKFEYASVKRSVTEFFSSKEIQHA